MIGCDNQSKWHLYQYAERHWYLSRFDRALWCSTAQNISTQHYTSPKKFKQLA